jgi:hypothetical protein
MRIEEKVAVIGGTGYFGGFVIAELQRRGASPVAVSRDLTAFDSAGFPADVARIQADAQDDSALDRTLDGARLVINCAGPFSETTAPVIAAAIRAGISYVDVCAEQAVTNATFEVFDLAARKAGVAVVPSVGFFGGLADLLVTTTLDEWGSADAVDVHTGLSQWRPTRGTRAIFDQRSGSANIIGGTALALAPVERRHGVWDFGGPPGGQFPIQASSSESILIPRHLVIGELNGFLAASTPAEVFDPNASAIGHGALDGSARQDFGIEVVARKGHATCRVSVQGHDSRALTARMIGEAAERLLDGRIRHIGVRAPGEIFDAADFLQAIDLFPTPVCALAA